MILRQNTKTQQSCIDATLLKLIAVVSMTADHLGAYGDNIIFIQGYIDELRVIGRLAAVLFLFAAIESLKHTKNRKKYIQRLYIASILTGLANLSVSACFGMEIVFGNVLQTYCWVVFTACAAEAVKKQVDRRDFRRAAAIVCGSVIIIGGTMCVEAVLLHHRSLGRILRLSTEAAQIVQEFISIILFSPRLVMYGTTFIILGTLWYFTNSRRQQIVWLVCICVFSYFLEGGNQWLMVMATPIIALYNGNKGRGFKYFFYIYYPLHCYIIAIVNKLCIPST